MRKLNWNWLFSFAWKDSRGNRTMLVLFMLSTAFGIASSVAILSLRQNLADTVEIESKSLLGADLMIQTRRAPSPDLRSFINRLNGIETQEVRFRSMARFENGESRFVQLRAIDGQLPLYGQIELGTDSGIQSLNRLSIDNLKTRSGDPPAIVEESLMIQKELLLGDKIYLGEQAFEIVGSMIRVSGESEISGFFAPRIFLQMSAVADTGLIRKGSIVRYRSYLAFEDSLKDSVNTSINEVEDDLFVEAGVYYQTLDDRKQSIQRFLDNLLDFLNLVGFISLLLGGVGITATLGAYLDQKIKTIAFLRCLGAKSSSILASYMIQVSYFVMISSMAGLLGGLLIQFSLPAMLSSFLPFQFRAELVPSALMYGFFFASILTTLFTLLPLLKTRKVSALQVLRAQVETGKSQLKDPLFWTISIIICSTLTGFVLLNSRKDILALSFLGGLAGTLLILFLAGWIAKFAIRRFIPNSLPYSLRLGLGNLYRPGNRTLLLISTLGLGTMLIASLWNIRIALLNQVDVAETGDSANVIALDIQPDQVDGMTSFLVDNGYNVETTLPIVTMRVSHINGLSLKEIKADPESGVSDWIYTWEFRNTYRDHILDNAEIVEGDFVREFSGQEPFPISISSNLLDDMRVKLGDTITWDIQGIPVQSVVSSIREIQWQAGRQNFNVVFPLNTIEEAPTIFGMSFFTGSRVETAKIQGKLLSEFPNVSLIDLSLVFDTINSIFSRISFIIQFMAGFTLLTGIIVFIGTLLSNRLARMRELILLQTIGASKAVLRNLARSEFLALGLISGIIGCLASIPVSAGIMHYAFQVTPAFDFPIMLVIVAALSTLTLFAGQISTHSRK